MKVAILSSASGGGAGIAAHRIYRAIKEHQKDICDVDFIDMRTTEKPVSNEVTLADSATNGILSNTHFTADYASASRKHIVNTLSQYDVINIHWCSYLLSIVEIYELAKSGKKIVFTLHDFYYFTGGCHYPSTCKQYLTSCKLCPQVNTAMMNQKNVEAAQDLKRKIFSFENVILTAPSEYIVNKAIAAEIIPKERGIVIRNAYEPVEGKERKKNTDGKIHVLVIADSFYEIRKQLQLAIDGFKFLAETEPSKVSTFVIHLVGKLDKEVLNQLKPYGYKVINHGHKSNHEDIVDVYCQVNYLLTPSLDDNWPNILVESGAYGVVPIVGPGHGCEEFVSRSRVGYVFKSYIDISVADSIFSLSNNKVGDKEEVRVLHDPKFISKKYFELFSIK